MPKAKRGDIWSANLEPQTHKTEPGKKDRPVLVIQSDLLNDNDHWTTIVIPGTTNIQTSAPDDRLPFRD